MLLASIISCTFVSKVCPLNIEVVITDDLLVLSSTILREVE